jgi:hypothetical protein
MAIATWACRVPRALAVYLFACLATVGAVAAGASDAGAITYSTTFPLEENPISEAGHWINGQTTGLDWADVRTTPGLAFGTETGFGGFDDSTAILTGAWGPDQTVQATVYSVNQQGGDVFEEVELRLRTSITPNSLTGYEVNFRALASGDGYTQVVRWNGPLNDFTFLDSRPASLSDGDIVKASIVGDLITVYINDVQMFQVSDNAFLSGSPGMGFYLQGATGLNADYGFTSFTASANDVNSTPEPSSLALFLAGSALLAIASWRRRKRTT